MSARGIGAALLGAVTLATLVPSDEAAACGNAVVRRVDPAIAGIADAERKGQAGEHVAALTATLRFYPTLRQRTPSDSPLIDRAMRVAARAVARSGGAVSAPSWPANTGMERQRSLEWASYVLGAFHRRDQKDAVAATDAAEVWSRLPARRADARALLVSLEGRDVMASAYGYAALARLRAGAGDGAPSWLHEPLRASERAGEIFARARCRSMARVASVCDERDEAAIGGGA